MVLKLYFTAVKLLIMGNRLKNNKVLLFEVLPCFSIIMITITFVLLYHTKIYSRLYYQQINSMINTSLLVLANNEDCSNNEDIFCKGANQIVEKPEYVAKASSNKTFRNSKVWQQRRLHDKHGNVQQINVSSHQKDNEQKQAELSTHRKGNQMNIASIGINITHIHGLLMEPVNINYSKNIYFTIKTTHRHYTDRLLPLMLTWLQAVDKNKVRYSVYFC